MHDQQMLRTRNTVKGSKGFSFNIPKLHQNDCKNKIPKKVHSRSKLLGTWNEKFYQGL